MASRRKRKRRTPEVAVLFQSIQGLAGLARLASIRKQSQVFPAVMSSFSRSSGLLEGGRERHVGPSIMGVLLERSSKRPHGLLWFPHAHLNDPFLHDGLD